MADGYVLLFGGSGKSGSLGDTWSFSSGHWTNLTASLTVAPGPRYRAGIAYDAKDHYVILFGGKGGPYLNDTWTFHAGKWTKLTLSPAPSPRDAMSMTYDGADSVVALFGGEVASFHTLNDTWSFAGGLWTNLTRLKSPAPSPRELSAVSFDPTVGGVLLFGGRTGVATTLKDTWRFANRNWTNLSSGLNPAPLSRGGATMVWDSVDNALVLFGGLRTPTTLNETWTFNGTRWSHLIAPVAPHARFDTSIAFDPNGGFGRLVLFGGAYTPLVNSTLGGDTWTFKVPLNASTSVSPSSIDARQIVNFSGNLTGGYVPYTFSWLGLPTDCQPAGHLAFSCHPAEAGTYLVQVWVRDGSSTNVTSLAQSLVVHLPLTAVATASNFSGSAPLRESFSALAANGTSPYTYLWSFGDGGSASSAEASYTYSSPGTYHASVRVVDGLGAVLTVELAPITAYAPIVASAALLPTSGVAPLTVSFLGGVAGGLAPFSFNWSFGPPGAHSAARNASYVYSTPGTYRPVFTVTDAVGEVSVALATVTVVAPLSSNFVVHLGPSYCNGGSAYRTGEFVGSAGGGLGTDTFRWVFPNETATGAVVNYTLPAATNSNVTLVVTDSTGASSVTSGSAGYNASLVASCAATPAGPGLLRLAFEVGIGGVGGLIAIELGLLYLSLRRARPPRGPPR